MNNEQSPDDAGGPERADQPNAGGDAPLPGVKLCPACGFRQHKVNPYNGVGRISAEEPAQTELCPNGCGPLSGVTWQQELQETMRMCQAQAERAASAEAALRDLVELVDLRACAEAMAALHLERSRALMLDYEKRMPLALATARTAAYLMWGGQAAGSDDNPDIETGA